MGVEFRLLAKDASRKDADDDIRRKGLVRLCSEHSRYHERTHGNPTVLEVQTSVLLAGCSGLVRRSGPFRWPCRGLKLSAYDVAELLGNPDHLIVVYGLFLDTPAVAPK